MCRIVKGGDKPPPDKPQPPPAPPPLAHCHGSAVRTKQALRQRWARMAELALVVELALCRLVLSWALALAKRLVPEEEVRLARGRAWQAVRAKAAAESTLASLETLARLRGMTAFGGITVYAEELGGLRYRYEDTGDTALTREEALDRLSEAQTDAGGPT